MSFRDQAALIVGGGSGMGFETARLLIESGAPVTLVGRSHEKLDHARNTLEAIGKVHTFHCGLTRKDDLIRLIRHVDNEMKEVKYLVNAAGVFSPKPFLEHTVDDYN